jgi:hypothetical protein
MTLTNATEDAILKLMLRAEAWATMADNAASTPSTNIYDSGHTADPGETGTQTTSELAYTSYGRVATPRSSSGWDYSNPSATLKVLTAFPAGTGGSGTMTHWGIGLSSTSTGTLLGSGAVSPNVVTGNGITPELTTASSVSLD